MATLSRHRPPHVAQGTWRSGALHVWGWNGIDTAPMAWLYGGFRMLGDDGRRTGWHDTPVSYGAIGRITIALDGQPGLHASSASSRRDGHGRVAVRPAGPVPTCRTRWAWFARIAELARRTVSAGRILPAVVEEGPFTVARWRPVTTPAIDATLAALDASMPPICTAGSSADATSIYTQLVDGIARTFLHQYGWKADLGRQRTPSVQVLRATFGALAKPDHVVRGGNVEFDAALRQLRDELDRHRRRVGGEPVVVPRLRLVISDDPHDPWIVRLELVDDSDASRWCSANDVWERNGTALEVAKGDQHLGVLTELIAATVEQIAPIVPGLAELAVQHEPTQVELDLDVAEDFLDIAPVELQRLGVELIGPERLIRTRQRGGRGNARTVRRPSQAVRQGSPRRVEVGDRRRRDLRRRNRPSGASRRNSAAHRPSLGAHRSPTNSAANRAKLTELKDAKRVVTPLELLRLANDAELGDDDTPAISIHDGDDDEAVDSAWVRNLLAGLPDERLDETHESPEFVGELRPYQRRGLGWLQFLARARPRRLPGRRHGPRQDPHHARPPGRRARAAPGGLPAVGRAQLGVRDRAVHARACGVMVHHGTERAHATRRCSSSPPHDLVITTYGAAATRPRHLVRQCAGPRSCSTRRRR